MRILQISESISSIAGGLQYTVTSLNAALRRMGCETLLVAGRDRGDLGTLTEDATLVDLLFAPRFSLFRGLDSVVSKFKPDVVFQHGLWPPYCAQITSIVRERQLPLIIHPHGMLDPYIISRGKLKKRIALQAYQRKNLETAKAFRALNQNEAEHIRRIVPNANVIIAPNGIDVSFEDVAQGHDLGREDRVLFLGRVDAKKGVLELLEAWASGRAACVIPQSARLTIAGWGSDKSYVDEVSARIAMSGDSVVFVGPAFGDAKAKLFASHGTFILPSKGEGLPTTVLEAWASSSLVLCSRECNFSNDEMESAAIDCGNEVSSIRDALANSFQMSAEKRLTYRNGGRISLRAYNWDKIAQNLISEIENRSVV